MQRLIVSIICILALSMVSAKTFKSKTKDNEAFTKYEVQVEQIDDTPTVTVITLNSLNTRRQVLVTQIANKQAELILLDALIVSVDVEASKPILKIPE